MKTLLIFIFTHLFVHLGSAQLLLNGDFSLGTLFWNCSPETNGETTYGGSNGFNTVAEVDAAAGLCQTVSGLTIGHVYALSFEASRRTGTCPAPLVTNVDITISSGVLFTTVTRTNTTFALTTSGFLFTATSNAHTITFSAGAGFGSGSCGLIIDNVAVTTSGLPIELLSFEGTAEDHGIKLAWATATEKNNDHFEVEKSGNGIDFQSILYTPSGARNGNSSVKLSYEANDDTPLISSNYYRLKQVDKDNTFTVSKIIAVEFHPRSENKVLLYPNPNTRQFTLGFLSSNITGAANIVLLNPLGKTIYSQTQSIDVLSASIKVNLPRDLEAGSYQCVISTDSYSTNLPVIIE